MKKVFFIIIAAAVLTAAAAASGGCSRPEEGWSIDGDGGGREDEDGGTADAGTARLSAGGGDAASEEDTSEETIRVHVCGAVVSPGVYSLPAGSRVADAVEAAGGMTEDAARDYTNLAAEIADAQKIVILTAEEAETDPHGLLGTASVSPSGTELVNINTADAERLQTLPGIGSARAEAIIAYRRAHGSFVSVEDIRNVSGIGAATWEGIRDLITVY